MVERLGSDAVAVLHKLADQAGDHLGADAWRDIARLAEGMLRDPCRLLKAALPRASPKVLLV